MAEHRRPNGGHPRFDSEAGLVDPNHRYGYKLVKGGYVACNCKVCNPEAKQPKRAKKPTPDTFEDNWSRV